MLTAGQMTVKSSRVRDPILPYMTSPPMPQFSGARPVCTENLSTGVMVVKSAKDGA